MFEKIVSPHTVAVPALVLTLAVLAGCRADRAATPQQHGGGHGAAPAAAASSESTAMEGTALPAGSIQISADRQQFLGVVLTPVEVRPFSREVRTVGRVEYDERRLAFVNTKFAGWIERLAVDFTGVYVRKGQTLMAIYSPDLVSAQEEYLQAVRAQSVLPAGAALSISARSADVVEAAKRRLLLWDIEPEHIGDLERTGTARRTLEIHSPISGYVVEKMALQGLRVEPGMNLYKIADISRVWIEAAIYEYEVPLVKLGQEAAVDLPYAPGERFRGRVSYIYPYLDEMTRTVKVRIEFPNPGGQLKPGMYADVRLQSDLGPTLVIPQSAVIDTGSRKLVFVSRGDGRFDPREIETGAVGTGFYQVLRGLEEGEKVVRSANFLIDSESQLSTAIGKMKH